MLRRPDNHSSSEQLQLPDNAGRNNGGNPRSLHQHQNGSSTTRCHLARCINKEQNQKARVLSPTPANAVPQAISM
jgi:hypothetical protein